MNVGLLCNREVVIAQGHEPAMTVARLMREHHVGDVVIVERREGKNYPTGIVTDRDIVVEGVVGAYDRLPQLLADDLVTRPLTTVREDDDVDHVLSVMRQQGVRRLPVVDLDESLLGIVAYDDIVEFFSSRLAELATVVARQERNERDARP